MKRFLLLILISMYSTAKAQQPETITFKVLDKKRVNTNKLGMAHLGAWGALNVVTGGAGYFLADEREWKAFHGMNAIWGATNALIAAGGYLGAKKEAGQMRNCDVALHRYESNKRLFLINAGLDVLYIGAGAYIHERGRNWNDPRMWQGFGKSFMVQGAALLLFDGVMFSLHQKQDKKWYKLVQGICVTGNGVGFRYQIE